MPRTKIVDSDDENIIIKKTNKPQPSTTNKQKLSISTENSPILKGKKQIKPNDKIKHSIVKTRRNNSSYEEDKSPLVKTRRHNSSEEENKSPIIKTRRNNSSDEENKSPIVKTRRHNSSDEDKITETKEKNKSAKSRRSNNSNEEDIHVGRNRRNNSSGEDKITETKEKNKSTKTKSRRNNSSDEEDIHVGRSRRNNSSDEEDIRVRRNNSSDEEELNNKLEKKIKVLEKTYLSVEEIDKLYKTITDLKNLMDESLLHEKNLIKLNDKLLEEIKEKNEKYEELYNNYSILLINFENADSKNKTKQNLINELSNVSEERSPNKNLNISDRKK